MTTTYYGIQDEHGTLVSLSNKGRNRSTTQQDVPFETGLLPKLYLSKGGAERALADWRRGELSISYMDSDGDGGDLVGSPRPDRAEAVVHVVEITFMVKEVPLGD